MTHDFTGAGSQHDMNPQPSDFYTSGFGAGFNHKTRTFNPLNSLARELHDESPWWHDLETGEPLNRNKGELLMLIVSEVAEAMEGERKDLMDDHLPHRKMAEVELADAVIRILDYSCAFGYDLDGAVAEKREYNKHRKDHTREARLAANGKKW